MTTTSERLTVALLADEHSLLLEEVDTRIERILDVLARGGWPDADVEMLLAYLRYVVLDQAAHEEGLLYPLVDGGFADQRLQRLTDEHVHLRDLADGLADALAGSPAARDPERLAGLLTDLTDSLADHLLAEEEVLTPVTPVGVEALRRPLHSSGWFLLTEGDVLDLDRLPRAYADWAAVERIARMRAGDRVEVRSGRSLEPLRTLLRRRGAASDFGWSYLEEGPGTWRAEITRRA